MRVIRLAGSDGAAVTFAAREMIARHRFGDDRGYFEFTLYRAAGSRVVLLEHRGRLAPAVEHYRVSTFPGLLLALAALPRHARPVLTPPALSAWRWLLWAAPERRARWLTY